MKRRALPIEGLTDAEIDAEARASAQDSLRLHVKWCEDCKYGRSCKRRDRLSEIIARL